MSDDALTAAMVALLGRLVAIRSAVSVAHHTGMSPARVAALARAARGESPAPFAVQLSVAEGQALLAMARGIVADRNGALDACKRGGAS